MASAVVLTSGNANAATGERGVDDARRLCRGVAHRLGVSEEEVLVCQTGLIGIPFPLDEADAAIPAIAGALGGSRSDGRLAAQAIMTTDTVVKEAVYEGDEFTVGGMAKGAAMLAPNMATMLAVLTTDGVCEPGALQDTLWRAVDRTFNRLSVDGCTSTNDTVILMASGESGAGGPAEGGPGRDGEELYPGVEKVCGSLARMMADDAEGATKTASVVVRGAESEAAALAAARKVAESQLVKCSLNGADPYWGRVMSELGSAGVPFDPSLVSISYGGVVVCRGGVAAEHDTVRVEGYMAGQHIEIGCDLAIGTGEAGMLFTDLGHGYIDENRTTS